MTINTRKYLRSSWNHHTSSGTPYWLSLRRAHHLTCERNSPPAPDLITHDCQDSPGHEITTLIILAPVPYRPPIVRCVVARQSNVYVDTEHQAPNVKAYPSHPRAALSNISYHMNEDHSCTSSPSAPRIHRPASFSLSHPRPPFQILPNYLHLPPPSWCCSRARHEG